MNDKEFFNLVRVMRQRQINYLLTTRDDDLGKQLNRTGS